SQRRRPPSSTSPSPKVDGSSTWTSSSQSMSLTPSLRSFARRGDGAETAAISASPQLIQSAENSSGREQMTQNTSEDAQDHAPQDDTPLTARNPTTLIRDALMRELQREVEEDDGRIATRLEHLAHALVDKGSGGDVAAIREVFDRTAGK